MQGENYIVLQHKSYVEHYFYWVYLCSVAILRVQGVKLESFTAHFQKATYVVTDEAVSLSGVGQQRSSQLAREEFVKARWHILLTELLALLPFLPAGQLQQDSANKPNFLTDCFFLTIKKQV